MVEFANFTLPSVEGLTTGKIKLIPRVGIVHDMSYHMRWRNFRQNLLNISVKKPNMLPGLVLPMIPVSSLIRLVHRLHVLQVRPKPFRYPEGL